MGGHGLPDRWARTQNRSCTVSNRPARTEAAQEVIFLHVEPDRGYQTVSWV